MHVLIAGSSGMIGTEVRAQLSDLGHRVTRLVRRKPTGENEIQWSPGVSTLSPEYLDGVDAVLNLAGASLSHLPWTTERKKDILHSRLRATGTLVQALNKRSDPPPVLVNGSAVGFYGHRPDQTLTEDSQQGTGFLSRVVYDWEEQARRAPDSVRVVTARTGLVIGNGGAMKPLLPLAKLGLVGPIAGGKQYWPWVSLHDEAAAIIHLMTSELDGPVNIAGPRAARSGDILHALTQELHRPYFLPLPRFAVEMALGEAGRELLLADQRVIPERLTTDGFIFRDATVTDAMRALVGSA